MMTDVSIVNSIEGQDAPKWNLGEIGLKRAGYNLIFLNIEETMTKTWVRSDSPTDLETETMSYRNANKRPENS